MPIGGVAALSNVVSPNMVGVDIGCGMTAVRTTLQELGVEELKAVMGEIRRAIPVGFNSHKEAQAHPDDVFHDIPHGEWTPIVTQEQGNAMKQLGTLGGGNHFIELQRDDDGGRIWIMLHSGSRNLGKKVCDHYDAIAKEMNARWHSKVDPAWDLAFLPLDSGEGETYLMEMDAALRFAYMNRQLMINRIMAIMAVRTGCQFGDIINIHHNYAALENHDGRNLVVHRKGATSARKGQIGLIPGSQGTASYVVEGLGNPASFQSCSHGAGRAMGRKDAQRRLVLADEIAKLDAKGVVHGVRHTSDLDEAAGAYKDIDTVMAEQADLVKVLVKLEPIGVIKG